MAFAVPIFSNGFDPQLKNLTSVSRLLAKTIYKSTQQIDTCWKILYQLYQPLSPVIRCIIICRETLVEKNPCFRS